MAATDLTGEVVDLSASFKTLEAQIDQRIEADAREILTLKERLTLIQRAALNHIDGDWQPHDTHWSEIVGIAMGEANWLHRARINYSVKYQRLVELSKRILESISEETVDPELAARMMADQIEQDLLPEMLVRRG